MSRNMKVPAYLCDQLPTRCNLTELHLPQQQSATVRKVRVQPC